jgi:hypothetical protein
MSAIARFFLDIIKIPARDTMKPIQITKRYTQRDMPCQAV